MEMIDFQLAQWIDNNPTIGAFESARKFAGGEVVYIEENVAVRGRVFSGKRTELTIVHNARNSTTQGRHWYLE